MTSDHKSSAAALPASRPGTNSRYRDDPDAVSMHTTRSDYEYDDVPELPSYDESVSGDSAARSNEHPIEAPPQDEYQVITQPAHNWTGRNKGVSPSKAVGAETSIRMDEQLLHPLNLHQYLTKYLTVVPPQPCVRVQGWHWETRKKDNKKEQERVYDFDIVLNMQAYLSSRQHGDFDFCETTLATNGDKRYRGTVFKVRAPGYKQDIEVGHGEAPNLMAWCKSFCESKSALKVFRLARNVTGLDTEQIKDSIVPLVRSTHYRGHIDITFPTGNKNVDIYTPHWINSARLSWVRWLFYLSFLWLITWPILFFLTKWWTVYSIDWRFSLLEPDRHTKVYATISEGAWVQKHANLIRSLVLDKFHGDGTDMPVNVDVEAQMRRASGDVRTGNRNVDAAVSFIQGSVGAWNALNGRGMESGWGADS